MAPRQKPLPAAKADDPPELPRPGTGRRGGPAHIPDEVTRASVAAMVAGGIAHADIAQVLQIAENTLRKHYRHELEAGAASLNTVVVLEWIKRIKAGDFAAIKWWTIARMGMSEKIAIDDPSRDQPLRVVVEFMGKAEAPAASRPVLDDDARLRGMGSVTGPRIPGSVVQLKG